MKMQINYLFSAGAAAGLANTIKTQFGWSGDLEDVQQQAMLLQLEHPEWEVKYIHGAIKKGALQAAHKSTICSYSLDDLNDDGTPKFAVEDLPGEELRQSQRGGEESVLGGSDFEGCTDHLKDQIIVKRGMTDRRYRQILQKNKERILDKNQPDLFGLGGGVSGDE